MTLVRLARDFVLLVVFSYRFWPRAFERFASNRRAVLLGGATAIGTALAYVVLFGRGALFDLGMFQTAAKTAAFLLVYVAAFRGVFGFSRKVSLLESLILLLALRAGQMLFTEVLVPLVAALPAGFDLAADELVESALVALLDAAFVLALAPRDDEVDDEAVSPLQIVLLSFTLVDYLVIKMTEGVALAALPAWSAAWVWSLVGGALQCLCIFVLCYVVKRTVAERYAANRAHRMNVLVEGEYAHILQRQKDDQRMRELRHDMRHVLALLRTSGDGAAAVAADRVERALGGAASVPFAGNAVLNMLLNEKAEQARRLGFGFDVKVNAGPCAFLDDYDVVAIFGNLLSNAFEAAATWGNPATYWVSFEVAERPPFVVFLVRNPLPPGAAPTLVTRKPGAGCHGLGLASVERSVGKYDGLVDIRTDGGVFSAAVSLPIPPN